MQTIDLWCKVKERTKKKSNSIEAKIEIKQ